MKNNPEIADIIKRALVEDIGAGDITSNLLIPENQQAELAFVAREEMVVCGLFIPELVYEVIGALFFLPPLPERERVGVMVKPQIQTSLVEVTPSNLYLTPSLTLPLTGRGDLSFLPEEGELVAKNTVLAVAKGNARTLLAGERVALNIMQRMCGIATLTKQYVQAVKGTKAVILDTRKTMVNLRVLDKYAVTVGGGKNHRMRLDDMVLIKDNHIALCGGIKQAVEKAQVGTKLPVIVECDTLAQVEEALRASPDRILLDNMDNTMLRKAVAMAAGKIPLEASGGVSLETVRSIAETGVDYISVGKITHSAPALDIGADIIFFSSLRGGVADVAIQ